MYEELKRQWAEVLSNVAKELLSWNLDDDNFPSSMWIQARFLPILLASGFGVQAIEPIVAYCGHVMAVRSADYWEATPPDHKVGMAFKQRAWGVFADAAGMKITPQPFIELIGDYGRWPVGVFLPDGKFMRY